MRVLSRVDGAEVLRVCDERCCILVMTRLFSYGVYEGVLRKTKGSVACIGDGR